MSTKKEIFLQTAKQELERGAESVTLFLCLPHDTVEVITNTNIETKAKYVEKAYDDDMRLKANLSIEIVDYEFNHADDLMDFPSALLNMKEGFRVRRKSMPKGAYLMYVPAKEREEEDKTVVTVTPDHIELIAPGQEAGWWVANQTDILAEDWLIVDEE